MRYLLIMESLSPLQLDVEEIVKNKAPKYASKIPGFAFRYLERVICQEGLNELLRENHGKEGVEFATAVLSDLNVSIKVIGEENIPDEGRFTFASNHPLGGLDGMGLISWFGKKYEGKIKFMVNDLLMNVKPLAPVFLPINKHGGQAKGSTEIINKAYESDDQILVFPAGLVSRCQGKDIRDLEWKKAFITKTVQFRRDIIPLYFDGLNSGRFYKFAQIRKRLGLKFNIEMIYLPSEMFKSRNKTFRVYVGKPIPWQSLDKSKTVAEWAEYIKDIVYHIKK